MTKLTKQLLIRSLFALMLAVTTSLSHAEGVVIVNAELNVDTLSKSQVADIFLDKINVFPTKEETDRVALPRSEPAYKLFSRQVLGRTLNQQRSSWSRLIFTGMGEPPAELSSAENIKDYVADNENAISFIDAADLSDEDEGIKVVFRY